MPTPIRLTEQEQERILQSAVSNLKKRLSENFENTTNLNIPINIQEITTPTIKPVVVFSEIAYAKCEKLVNECSGEVGWQGLVTRTDNTFIINDILVYPQTVSAATVTVDELEYAKWMMKLPVNQLKQLRFQAHSHVRMGVTPSSTDLELYQNYLKTLKNKDDFYIFMILNKSKDYNIWLYDLKTNMKYSTSEIKVKRAYDIDKWYAEITKANLIKTHTYNSTYAEESDLFWNDWNKKYFGAGSYQQTNYTKTNKNKKGGKKK